MARSSLGYENFANKGCKIATQKKIVFQRICLTSRIFLYQCDYPHQLKDVLSPVCGILKKQQPKNMITVNITKLNIYNFFLYKKDKALSKR